MNTTTGTEYKAQSARDAQASGYGSKSYWDYLEQSAHEHHRHYLAKGDKSQAALMLTQSLSDSLAGNEGA